MSTVERPLPPLNTEAEGATLGGALAAWRAEIARAREQGVRPPQGHADLLRERIDGATGA